MLPALAAVVTADLGRRRVVAVRHALHLPAPEPWRDRLRLAGVAAVVALVSLAAAQPALTHEARLHVRQDVQALFVVDISRSMAASSGPGSPSRLDRAGAAAVRLRAAIPTVASGVATLTDRVLPSLLPVPDRLGFDEVMARGVAIESPPPQDTAVRATAYDALGSIAGGGYFSPGTASRLVVVLTDGESSPVQTDELARAFGAKPGFHFVFIRFWRDRESIYDADGRRETAYRPDPSGSAVLASLASAVGGSAYGEGDIGAAERRLQALAGDGPAKVAPGPATSRTPLAPYVASAALVLIAALVLSPLPGGGTRIRWHSR